MPVSPEIWLTASRELYAEDMKLKRLAASRYRSLRQVSIEFNPLNLFIGVNAAGKSNVLDTLSFMSSGVREKDFSVAVNERGGILALAWKGEAAREVELTATFEEDGRAAYEWSVSLTTPDYGFEFGAQESIKEIRPGSPSNELLWSKNGEGWWWSNESARKVTLAAQTRTSCALAAAAADASFPARSVADFVARWAFFDPSPVLLRRASREQDSAELDQYGRNLAARLRHLQQVSPKTFQRILNAMDSILGIPDDIEIRESEDGRVHFVQSEIGLEYKVHQTGASSGTLRMLALITALVGEEAPGLVGIEEPENHVHPSALQAFAEHIREASKTRQVLVTTHSPLLLDAIGDAESVFIVRRTENGTVVEKESHPDAVRKALVESGFALGEFYETKGFGA